MTNTNRGRFQAQGKRLEKSEAWAQQVPLVLQDSLTLINDLENKIPQKEYLLRQKAFLDTKEFVKRANLNGGISVRGLANFSKTFLVSGKERVDIEVHAGEAFI